MPSVTRSKLSKTKNMRMDSSSQMPVETQPGESFAVPQSQDISTHLNTISSFLNHIPNVPREVIDSFRALQTAITASCGNCEQYLRQRSIVIHGVPELPKTSLPSIRQADVENKVSEILDTLGVEARPWAVFRMGRRDDNKPRLTKVILPSRSQYFTVLGRARLLRDMAEFKHIYVRASLTEAERRRDFDLRMQARERNQALGRKEFVVYRGEIVKISDIPARRQSQVMLQEN
ncbi:hypothetical protein Y032_0264g615 [Ancylostoma ceylanicum]|uniref:Uncharacterized protein n=1 Tax=Ancylostoma ceylanicum TaxID=53326 RepID=A0A016S9N4_9BILA|nr:hypothetical protein Y032_0264g615 [Ancylostoma ceylanicum]